VELRQLQYFVTIAEELHFGRAAERLHIVQPAVSRQLRRLEAELGVELVERSSRHVALTPAGRRLLPEARAVLEAAARARAAVAAVRAPETLRLGTSAGLGERLPRLLGELDGRLPSVRVELVRVPAAQRLAQVADGALDAAFVRGPVTRPGLRLEPVWADPLLVALPAGRAPAAGAPVPLRALAGLPLRLPAREENPPLVELVLGACRDAGFEPRLEAAMNDQDMLAAIASGAPSWTVYYAAQASLLSGAAGVAFRPSGPPLAMTTSLALRAQADGPVVEALLGACAAVGGPPGASTA
jgi:DNA-binding transcriptional LysR family regulator